MSTVIINTRLVKSTMITNINIRFLYKVVLKYDGKITSQDRLVIGYYYFNEPEHQYYMYLTKP